MDVTNKINKILNIRDISMPQATTVTNDHLMVIQKIEKLLEQLPEVDSAVGKITVAVKGQPPKTLTFKYN